MFLQDNAFGGLAEGERFETESRLDGAHALTRGDLFVGSIPQPFEALLLKEETLVPQSFTMLVDPGDVLLFGMLAGAPFEFAQAGLPGEVGRPVLQRTERWCSLKVSTEIVPEREQAALRPEAEVDVKSRLGAAGGAH